MGTACKQSASDDLRPSAGTESKPATAATGTSVEALLLRVEREPNLACEIGYEQTKEAMKNPPVGIDVGPLPPFELAPKDVYMADCLRMPRTVQKCVVFAYAMTKNAECERARREYDAENQRRFAPTRTDGGAK